MERYVDRISYRDEDVLSEWVENTKRYDNGMKKMKDNLGRTPIED